MRRFLSGFAALALLAAGCASKPASQSRLAGAGSLIVTGVAVLDPESGVVSAPQDILIDAGRIVQLAPVGAMSVPAGTLHIDGSGKFAVPGLIDVHAHVGEGGIAPQNDESRKRALAQFLRYGVTSIFVPGATGASDADLPGLRARCRAGGIACPGLYGSGSIITAPGGHPVSTIFNMPDTVSPATVELRGVTLLAPGTDIDKLVAAKAAAGADAIKIIVEDGPPPWYPKPRLSDAQIKEIVRAAHARSLPVYAHISSSELTRVAVDAGVDGIMHAPINTMSDTLVQSMAKRRTWYVPTFALYDGILTWARKARETDPYALKGVEPSAVESLAQPGFLAAAAEDEEGAIAYLNNANANLRRVAAAGVPLALGSDVNNPFVYPGYSAHEELALMVKAGLTPQQALRAATAGGAAFLGATDRLGRIAPGFEADILLLSRNPLVRIENSRSIATVITDGRIVRNPVSDR
jgi:imidazolonepropionase-like amidohydrolase